MTYILAVDIGTTHCRAILYSIQGEVKAVGEVGYETKCEQLGMAEQDPYQVSEAVDSAVAEAVQSSCVPAGSIEAVVFSSVWHSLIGVDERDRAITPLFTWADSRSMAQSDRLAGMVDRYEVRNRTGCPIHPMYFPAKLLWLREEHPNLFSQIAHFVSIKEFVLRRWVGDYAVDVSVASGTGLLNVSTLEWDSRILGLVGIEPSQLSRLVEPTYCFRPIRPDVREKLGLSSRTKVVIGAADGALAHIAAVGTALDGISLSVGTGAAVRRLALAPRTADNGETWCYYLACGRWLHGGLVQDAGIAFSWLTNQLFSHEVHESRQLGLSPYHFVDDVLRSATPGAQGLVFLPFLLGERSPNLRPGLKGALFGITLSATRAEIMRALVEGIAYRLKTVYDCLVQPGERVRIVATGGFLKTPEWVQIVCDLFGKEMYVPLQQEGSAWGAALVAMLSIGIVGSFDEMNKYVTTSALYTPRPEVSLVYRELLPRFAGYYKVLCQSEELERFESSPCQPESPLSACKDW